MHMASDEKLVKKYQKHILSMHVEFLYPCEAVESITTVDVLRVGAL